MKHDLGHKMTEKQLLELEKRIAMVYREAKSGLDKTIADYFESFKKRDEHQRQLLEKGEITEEQYKLWRLNQIGRGKRFEALRDEVAKRYTEANETAIAYVNDETPGIYSLNRNYAAYTIEKEAGNVGFNLWDEQTAKRLIVEDPDLMPYYPPKKAVKRGIDLAWGKRQITASVTSGILQGYSIGKIADDLQDRIETMNRASAIRAARTAVTGAQNAGRQDSYVAAEKMGIKMKREWLATLDNRTRHAHAILDGQRVAVNEPFQVDGHKIMFPGDPTAEAYLIYNCRCTLIAAVDGVNTSDALRRDKDGLIPDMTFAQWEASKRGNAANPISAYNVVRKPTAKDVTAEYLLKPKKTGKIRYEKGYNKNSHKAEVSTAEILHSVFGGKIILKNETNEQGIKTPDYLWNRKFWEQKSVSSAKAVDSALRSALKQIKDNPGGVVFVCDKSIRYDEMIIKADERALRGKIPHFTIIAIKDGDIWFVREYKK